MNTRFFGIAAILALTLTACPGTTTPTVSSISVTAPSSNALKINEAVQFNAVAKDDKDAVMTGKTFSWVSSDPNVATVDADGKVTAKRFGTVKITASVDGKSGESASQTTFGLEVIGGVASNGAGTAFLIRFRNPDDTGAKANMNMTVTGPATWNGGTPYTRNGFYVDKWSWFQTNWFGSTVSSVSGNYTVSATVNSKTYTSSFTLDAAQSLPEITGLAISSASASSVTGSWNSVANAKSYMVEIWNDTDGRTDGPTQFVTSTNAVISGLNLNAAKTYYFQVHALGTDVTAPLTTPINTQHNVKFNRIQLATFATPAATGTVNGYSIDSSLPTKPAKLNVSGVDASGGVIKTGSIANPSVSLASIKVSSRDVVQVRASSYVPTDVTASVCGQVTGQTGATAAAIALDSTGSMATTDPPSTPGDFTTTKRNLAAKLYLDRMGKTDVATVSSFDGGTAPTSPYSAIKLWQTFSSDTTLLKAAVDSATFAGSGTNLWDASFDSADLVATRSETNKVAVILTDGEDTISLKTPANVISNANNKYVKLFLVGLSSAAAPLSATALTNMQSIASGTGGVFALASDATALSGVFNGIFNATQGSACVSLVFTPLPPVNTLIQGTLGFSMNGGAVTAPFTVQY